jgi:hypothetical protein
VTFSAVILIIAGIMRLLDAIWAFRNNSEFANNLSKATFGSSLTGYGWLWLIVGLILIGAGLILIAGTGISSEIARWIGVGAAAIEGITAVSWMPYYPVWSLVYVGLAVTIIYGLIVHFHEWDESTD